MDSIGLDTVVLLSGGLDSTVNLYQAQSAGRVKLALSFNYQQKALVPEIACAQRICRDLGIPHKVIELPFFADLGASSLTSEAIKLPLGAEVNILDHQQSLRTASKVWVPNRNGVFLNLAGAFAEAANCQAVVVGFNQEEASTFPDNSAEYLAAATAGFKYSTSTQVKCISYTLDMNKAQIVKKGLELGVDFRNIWPCYQAFEKWCGQCESCLRSKRAFEVNGLSVLFAELCL